MFSARWSILLLRMMLNAPGISLQPIPYNALILCWRETKTLLRTAIHLSMFLLRCTAGCVNCMSVRACWMPGVPLDFYRWLLPNASRRFQGWLGLIFAQNHL